MYTVRNGYIYDGDENTGIKAPKTKSDLQQFYGISRNTLNKWLSEIQHKIYKRNNDGSYDTQKRMFAPIEVGYIIEYYGLSADRQWAESALSKK